MKKLRVSSIFNLLSYPNEDFSEYIRAGLTAFKEIGYDTADFGTGMLDLSSDRCLVQTEQALSVAEEIGFRFEISHLPFMVEQPKTPEIAEAFNKKMYRAIDAVKLLGVDHAVMHPNATTIPTKAYKRQEQYDLVMRHLAPFVEYADRVGVNVVVENMRIKPSFVEAHRYCQFPDELCEVADALGIGVCWDFGHANISGVRQSEGLAYVGKRLKVLHINDNTAFEDDHIPPFAGNVDWKDAMHGLALAGFDGPLNYEVEPGRVPATLKKDLAKYLLAAADTLMSFIE